MGKKKNKNKGSKKNKKQDKDKKLSYEKKAKKQGKKKKPRILKKIFIGLILWISLGVILTNIFGFDAGNVAITMWFLPFILIFVGAGFVVLRGNIRLLSIVADTASVFDDQLW